MRNLGRLPHDSLLEILSHVPPRDIVLGARQTCRSLYQASKPRALWMDVLQRVCKEENLFLPTYPLDTMTDLDLEHAATAPARFLSRLESHNPQVTFPAYMEQFLEFEEVSEDYGVFGLFKCLYVVPGGRFLITSHVEQPIPPNTDWTMTLNIWDVGWRILPDSVPPGEVPLTPIASLENLGVGNMSPVHPTRDGKGLILFTREDDYVSYATEEQRSQTFHIYTLFPKTILPPLEEEDIEQEVHKLATLELHVHGPEKSCLSFERLAVVFDSGMIVVWDFNQNEAVTWTAPILNDDYSVHAIYIKDNRVIVIRDLDLLIWDTPALFSCQNDNAYEVQNIDPTWGCPLNSLVDPESGQSFRFSVEKLDDWYTDSGRPIYFDLVIDSAEGSPSHADGLSGGGSSLGGSGSAMEVDKEPLPTIYRYELTVPNSFLDRRGHPGHPETVLKRVAVFNHPVIPRDSDIYSKFYRFSGGDIVNSFIPLRNKDLHIYDYKIPSPAPSGAIMPPHPNPTITYFSLPRAKRRSETLNFAAVCPSSGRIFLYLQRNTGELVIVDTLNHPEQRFRRFIQLDLRMYNPNTDPMRQWVEAEDEDMSDSEESD